MIAKLHRFYGPAPTRTNSWLDVPEWLFQAYDRAQPRLEAEEAQMLLESLVAGTGHMKEEAFESYQRRLARISVGDRQTRDRTALSPRSKEEMEAMIGSMGLRGFKVDIKD